MMHCRRLWLLASIASGLLAACTTTAERSEPGRIGSLDREQTRVETATTEPIDESEALENYRRYLELGEDSQEREEALRRVADLKVEVEDSGQAGEGDVDSIAYYQELLRRYPHSAANERVLYQLARAYEVNDQPDQALRTFDELLEQFPNARAEEEIRFRRAELLFRQRNYSAADQAYGELLGIGSNSRFYEKALYKQGWARYKQSRYIAALRSFDQLLRQHPDLFSDSGIKPGAGSEGRSVLLDDSLRTMALSLSLIGDADRALEEIERLGNTPYERALRVRLASLYQQRERYTDAARVFETESRRAGSADDALRAIAALEAGGFDAQARDAKARYLQAWPNMDEKHSVDWSRMLARHHHARAQKEKDTGQYADAEGWYRYYLKYHGDRSDAGEIRFLLAELLFEQQRYEQAATTYSEAAAAGGGRAGDAAYAAVLARRALLKQGSSTERNERLVDVIDQDLAFADNYGSHPQAPAVRLRAAEDLYTLGNRDQAAAVAQSLKAAPSIRIRLGALKIVAAHAAAGGDYAAAGEAYSQIIPHTEPGAERDSLEAALATALYRQGETARNAGDSETAIARFLQIGRQTPNAPVRAAADYDAASMLIATEQWDQAVGILEAFRARFPDHDLAEEAQRKLALAYQNSGRKIDAAQALSGVARSGKTDVARAAAWQAAELLREAGATRRAMTAYEAYLDQYPSDFARGMEARRRLADLESLTGKGPRYRQRLEAIIAADTAAGEQRSDRSRTLAARASMELALEAVAAFESTALKPPLDRSLRTKTSRLETAQAALTRTVSYDIADISTAATFHIGELYTRLSRDLIESPRPAGLDAEAREQYAVLLEERAFPFEEQAIAVHERNIARARQGDYDDWVERSYRALLKLAPAQYAKQEESVAVVEEW